MLSVAGMIAFFIMIFDSMRQGRAVTRNSFGVPRFNTRLNFYIYEGARTWYLQRRGWYASRFNGRGEQANLARVHKKTSGVTSRNLASYYQYEYLETTVFTYVLVKGATSDKNENN
jgi:hypothetical protein